ncbi:transporter, bile acid/Na+ symporter family [Salmonella bongori]|nr:transporter, bile acid/Na+ symporter family [Salmonella bongori]
MYLPATVQSAIAFTSLAGGNVAAAVCSASASSLLGIFLSPLLVGLVMNIHGAQGSLEEVGKIMLQLLLPFVLGHLSRPWIGNWVARNKKVDSENGSDLYFAGGLLGVQRSGGLMVSGTKSAGVLYCLLSWSASYCWRSS